MLLVTADSGNGVVVFEYNTTQDAWLFEQIDRNNLGGPGGLADPTAVVFSSNSDTAYVASLGGLNSPDGLATLSVNTAAAPPTTVLTTFANIENVGLDLSGISNNSATVLNAPPAPATTLRIGAGDSGTT